MISANANIIKEARSTAYKPYQHEPPSTAKKQSPGTPLAHHPTTTPPLHQDTKPITKSKLTLEKAPADLLLLPAPTPKQPKQPNHAEGYQQLRHVHRELGL